MITQDDVNSRTDSLILRAWFAENFPNSMNNKSIVEKYWKDVYAFSVSGREVWLGYLWSIIGLVNSNIPAFDEAYNAYDYDKDLITLACAYAFVCDK